MIVTVIVPFVSRLNSLCEALESATSVEHKIQFVIAIDSLSELSEHKVISHLSDCSALGSCTNRSFTVVKSQRSPGPSGTRNAALDLAVGEYVFFLDDDDVFMPGKIDLQVSKMQARGAGFSYTNYLAKSSHGYSFRKSKIHGPNRLKSISLARFDCNIATPTVAVLRSLMPAEVFPEEISQWEDQVAWHRIIENGAKVLGLKEALTIVDLTGESVTRGPNRVATQRPQELTSVRLPLLLWPAFFWYSFKKYLAQRVRP